MKKLTILFLALLLAGGNVMAQGTNLPARSDELMPGLDLFAEMGMPLMISPELLQSMDFNLRVDYNLNIAEASKLTFILENMTFIPFLRDDMSLSGQGMPDSGATNRVFYEMESWLNPGVKYTQTLDFGNLYAQVDAPINITREMLRESGSKAFDELNLNFTLGWESNFGLWVNARLYNHIKRNAVEPGFLESLGVSGSYEFGPLNAGVEVGVPLIRDGIRNMGLTVIPELGYTLMPNFRLFGSAEFMNILAENDVNLNMSLGAKFSF